VGGLTAVLPPEADASGRSFELPSSALPCAGLFRFGRLIASVRTNDAEFARRFARIFADCQEREAPTAPACALEVFLPPQGERVFARIAGHGLFDAEAARALLPGVAIEAHGEHLAVPRTCAWPIFFAHYFVHHVMARQPEMLFLHGATVDVNGRGLFLGGAKGSGKSTLALALGARGHAVLGDEVAAIDPARQLCLPFRRAVSIREGPQARAVARHLERTAPECERLSDGTSRRRVPLSELFPGAAARPVRLEAVVFLRGFAAQYDVEPVAFSVAQASWVGPLLATFAGRPAGLAALRLVDLFSRLRCHSARVAGEPEAMAERLEAIAENRWAA
jgi:hypothetical protein